MILRGCITKGIKNTKNYAPTSILIEDEETVEIDFIIDLKIGQSSFKIYFFSM